MAGLQHFRRPDVDVKEGQVTVFGIDERVPVPLNITHKPLAVTFHTFNEGKTLVLDATLKEEQAAEGDMIVALNSSGETCALYKSSGCVVSAIDVINKTAVALQKVQELNVRVAKALETDLAKREKQNRGAEASAENDR
jgi:exosome complex component RRP45